MPERIEAPGSHFGASGRHSAAMNARLIGSRFETDLAAGMIQRFFAPTLGLLIGLALGSCAPFAATVSDHWPTWAGGMPKDVPPRPGAPGYDEFLKHQQGKDVTPAAAPGENANAQAAPPSAQPANNQGSAQGGLY